MPCCAGRLRPRPSGQQCPRAEAVKHRVHVDVGVAALPPVLDLGYHGAPAEESGFRWSVVADPEGASSACSCGTTCRPIHSPGSCCELAIDTAHDEGSARPWPSGGPRCRAATPARTAGSTGGSKTSPTARFACFTCAPVPGPKAVKNRIHWDVTSAELPAFLDRGATVLAPPTEHAVARVRGSAGQRVLRLRPA